MEEPRWCKNVKRDPEFIGGKEAWDEAATTANQCLCFIPDDEDEQVADDPISCYNCRCRRWTALSFICMKSK